MNLNGFRGWYVKYYDGTEIYESEAEWKDVPKIGIKRLTLHFDGRQWDIVGKRIYLQKKHASICPWVRDSIRIESRSIGYYEGTDKIIYTVDEWTGVMKMEVKDIS